MRARPDVHFDLNLMQLGVISYLYTTPGAPEVGGAVQQDAVTMITTRPRSRRGVPLTPKIRRSPAPGRYTAPPPWSYNALTHSVPMASENRMACTSTPGPSSDTEPSAMLAVAVGSRGAAPFRRLSLSVNMGSSKNPVNFL